MTRAGGPIMRKQTFAVSRRWAAVALLAAFLILGGSLFLEAGEVDCGDALNRCLKEIPWWEKILNPDFCFVGFFFCLLYMQ